MATQEIELSLNQIVKYFPSQAQVPPLIYSDTELRIPLKVSLGSGKTARMLLTPKTARVLIEAGFKLHIPTSPTT
ncbi:hypothetical protein A3C34_02550 [Candidatus Amesbacteria bacterium RIFCSPHIGHO2_02_FULL_48_21]|uniref:Uncharacterized protein n=1 Tax=Candidatus Amesbacteria bacterium RIFCSPHIGHO2_12_FULL_48_14 TaxID=1797257 RepID=A0A1F4Z9T3_9BACT|nr:MAG: hypothetical protein A2V48_00185 [Candidatus Amesbacteria bacterium RBG_19FT_COMBO_48_16]OGC96304.1 MAG: hypothetical protein A3C34_02550 [Candidatus Amesbacteria bacterium RIFCSPHIGHO2_02_FULL_48_21]OGC97558.1 MAG: hypothetical protein A2W16_03070 [Candidatus Amesbacteria bacterium RBG_16_48_31]OGD03048.1 MAG: hypothetical protein A3E17_00585 [Candidatus Amesbacteria bacterium RIFCSPHIGHO2_12_FULL_48_14]